MVITITITISWVNRCEYEKMTDNKREGDTYLEGLFEGFEEGLEDGCEDGFDVG